MDSHLEGSEFYLQSDLFAICPLTDKTPQLLKRWTCIYVESAVNTEKKIDGRDQQNIK
jgi:hypothetical protein